MSDFVYVTFPVKVFIYGETQKVEFIDSVYRGIIYF